MSETSVFKTTPVSIVSPVIKFETLKNVFANVAFVKLTFVRFEKIKVTSVKFASVKFASVKFALVRVAPIKMVPFKLAPVKSAPFKLAPVKSAPDKSALVKSVINILPLFSSVSLDKSYDFDEFGKINSTPFLSINVDIFIII